MGEGGVVVRGGSYTNLADCVIRHLDYISGILTSHGGGCYPFDPPTRSASVTG